MEPLESPPTPEVEVEKRYFTAAELCLEFNTTHKTLVGLAMRLFKPYSIAYKNKKFKFDINQKLQLATAVKLTKKRKSELVILIVSLSKPLQTV